MAEKRKLLAEIEKCYKKIDEGIELFNITRMKLAESNSENQREKLQDDLKKEIKKLQRLRDQVKSWQSSSDIKDKEKLTEYRRMIETQMETFKEVERDHKTKPHSKQGLSAEEKLDPKEKERQDIIDWLNNKIQSLNDENDKYEASLELLLTGDSGRRRGKAKEDPKKAEKENHLRMVMETFKFHIDKLELCMRLVENDSLEAKTVQEAVSADLAKLFLDLENDGTIWNCEAMYDYFDLDSFAVTFGKNPSVDDEKHDELHTNGRSSPEHSSRHPSTDVPPSPALVKRGNSTSSNHHAPLKISESVDGSSSSFLPPPIVSPSVPPTPPPPPVIPYNSIAAGAARSANSTPASVSSKWIVAGGPPPGVSSPLIAAAPSSPSINSPAPSIPPPLSPSTVTLSLSSPLSASLPPPPPLSASSISSSTPSTPPTVVSRVAIPAKDENGVSQPVQENTQHSSLLILPSHTTTASAAATSLIEMTKNTVEDVRSLNDGMSSMSDDLRTVLRMSKPEPKSMEPQTAHIPAYLGASPLGRAPPIEDHDKHVSALEVALQRLPQQMDSERPRSYLPKMPCSTPAFYPQQAPSNSDSMEYYLRLSPETLFFTFYYMEGSRAQLIAAKALKKLSWRFHTKYLMWFQRHEEPKQITDDFEEGTYIYFDYEKWSQRKKEQFRFEYRYLEDRELD